MADIIPIDRATKPFQRGDHVELAERLVADLRAEAPAVHTDGGMYHYAPSEGVYSVLERPALSRRLQRYAGAKVATQKGPLRLKASDVAGAVVLAGDQAHDDEFFAYAKPGVAFADAFVEVTSDGVLRHPHSPKHRARWAYPFQHVDGQAPDEWLSFMRSVWHGDEDADDKIALVQEYTGVCILGIATRFQRAIVQLGDGANGKGVASKVIEACMPPGSVCCIPPQDIGQEYRRHLLAGKLLNIVSELPEAEILDSESWKAVVAGDAMTAREIRQSPYTFVPIAGHIYSANRLPGSTDQTHGFWRRLVVLRFNRVFAEDEQIPNLAELIVARERPRIVSWALRGAQRVIAAGRLTVPASSVAAREQWRESADQVHAFVEECCTRVEGDAFFDAWTPAAALYRAYRSWAEENGHGRLAANKFGERMRLLGLGAHRTKHARLYPVRLGG